MKPVARCTPKARLSKRISPTPPVLLPAGPLPPGYAAPYPPPAYYYPYPYPPPPYHPHQYPPMPPLQSQPIPPPPSQTQTQPKQKKRATTSEAPKSMPPRLVSSRSSSPETAPTANKKSSPASEKGFITPHENDVLMGRGGKNNTHIGNEKLREMARNMREVYIKSRKKEKTNMARQLVHRVFALNPPGRFLQRDPVTMAWEEVDMDTARHKTSQCLRDAATEKSSYHKIKPEAEETSMEVDAVNSTPQVTPSRPSTPEQSTTTEAESSDSINRAMTPVRSNLANKIEPSPLPPPSTMDSSLNQGVRSRMESWEMGSIANVLIESWEENNDSFGAKPRLGSLDISTGSNSQRMYTWMANSTHDSALDMDMEDAVLIPPEELDETEAFTLLDVSHLDDEVEMQLWHPDNEESENPFDTEFFY